MSNVTVSHGETLDISGTVYANEEQTEPKDLTGGSVAIRIGTFKELHLGKVGTVDNGPQGLISVSLSESEVNALPIGTWRYEFFVTDGSGSIDKSIEGDIVVNRSIPSS